MAKDRIETPLARARGHGSARDGVHHWFMQRVTAISNLFLMIWLVWSVVTMASWSHADFTTWLAMPVNAVLMILAVISVFYHAALGSQVIVEDYFHHEGLKIVKLIGMKLFFAGAAVACIFAVLKVALGG